MKVGGILVGDGIDHWGLANDFIACTKKDQFDVPVERRVVLFRDSYIELHINPLSPSTDDGKLYSAMVFKDHKDR